MSWVQSRASHEITGFFTYQVGLDFKDLIFSASKESGASLEEVLQPLWKTAGLVVCVSEVLKMWWGLGSRLRITWGVDLK